MQYPRRMAFTFASAGSTRPLSKGWQRMAVSLFGQRLRQEPMSDAEFEGCWYLRSQGRFLF